MCAMVQNYGTEYSISLPILDTPHKNNFFAGERRYSNWYQKTSQD